MAREIWKMETQLMSFQKRLRILSRTGLSSIHVRFCQSLRGQQMGQQVKKNVEFGEERSINKLKGADKGGTEKRAAGVKIDQHN